jgi:hypothetical protein
MNDAGSLQMGRLTTAKLLRWLCFGAAGLGTLILAGSPTRADSVTIDASYDMVFDRLRPNPRAAIQAHHTVRVRLSADKKVAEEWFNTTSGLVRRPAYSRVLGERSPEGGVGEWQVAGPSELRRVLNFPQNITTLTISVTGTECSLRVSFLLKPNFSEFTYRRVRTREWAYYSQPRILKTQCAIR